MSPLAVIRRYYDGCSAGDVDAMRATLEGFPYAARGYSTDGAERSAIHDTGE